ncbi:hypothetical protein PUN28_010475 [Cardiocondyla obscurior]|uniref:C2H2-type domain-containing protein n=1 Tax=Cardiocondyla obscurior TaxID=286306 RepID=A0AAW2FLZ6_9HYME
MFLDFVLNVLKTDGHQYRESIFQCPQCDKKYTLEQNLKRHIKSAHTNFQINCEYCKKIFKRSDVYKKHLYTQHSKY